MKVGQVKELITNLSENEVDTPLLLIGGTGIGKSWLTKEVAASKGIGFVDLRLATQEVTDLIGIPKTIRKNNTSITEWARPCWFPEEGTKGILALEEVNRAPEDVRQAIFQLLTEHKLHTHTLPRGWIIVALINPDNGMYHVNQLDPAFKRRFVQVIVNTPETTDWCIWAKQNKVDTSLIRFVAQFPKLLNKEEDIEITATATPAGYHMLSQLIDNNVIPNNCLHEVASGIIGVEASTAYVQSLKNKFEKPITAQEIFKDYTKVKTKHKRILKESRNDMVYMTMVDVISECEVHKFKQSEISNFIGYLEDCSAETLTTIILRIDNEKILDKLGASEELLEKIVKIKKDINNI